MNDVRTILERGVGGAAPPPDAFERMLRRHDRKRRNRRLAAAAVGIAVFVAVAVAALALRSYRTSNVPGSSPTKTSTVFTFFGPNGMVSVNGVVVKTTSQHPKSPPGTPITELDSRYVLDPIIDVPAGAPINVGPEVTRGWVDAYDLSEPAQRLYELDLTASPSMPEEPGTYYLEFSVGSPAEGGPLTFLVPVRVVASQDS